MYHTDGVKIIQNLPFTIRPVFLSVHFIKLDKERWRHERGVHPADF